MEKNIPNGHERTYRRGFADSISVDRRRKSNYKHPKDIPKGHGKSYDKGYEDGKKKQL